MGQIPLPTYEQLRAMAKDDEALDAFLRGLVLNPVRQSPWSRWHTRKLRRLMIEMGA